MTMTESKKTMRNKIPYELSSICAGVSVDRIAVMIKKDELCHKSEPGICRFCHKDLGVKFVEFDLGLKEPAQYPVLQCERVANLYEAACRKEEQWQAEAKQRRIDLAHQAKKKEEPKAY